jgi:hypothetical protein
MWVAAVAFAVIIAVLNLSSRGWSAPVMVLAVVALCAYYARAVGWHPGLLAALIVASLVDRYTFAAGPVAIRTEEVAGIVVSLVLAFVMFRERSLDWLRPNAAEALLLAWLALSVVSSLIASPDRRLSAKIILLVAICALGFFLPRRLLTGKDAKAQLETVIRWLLIVLATEAGWGSVAYLTHIFGPTISITPNPASGHLSAYGTLWEQNVFGAIVAAGAVAWIYLGSRRFRNAWVGVAICMSGLVDSLTRAAWLAAAAVGAVGLVVPGLRRRLDLVEAATGLLGGVVAAGGVLFVESTGTYTVAVTSSAGPVRHTGLFGAIFNMTDFIGRINQSGPIWADIRHDVLFGRGTASFEALHVIDGVPQHVASLPLLVLNDTGVVGLIVFTAFGAAVVARVWARRQDDVVTGLSQVAIVLVLANLATQTTELMVGWLLIGILVAATYIAPGAEVRRSEVRTRAA